MHMMRHVECCVSVTYTGETKLQEMTGYLALLLPRPIAKFKAGDFVTKQSGSRTVDQTHVRSFILCSMHKRNSGKRLSEHGASLVVPLPRALIRSSLANQDKNCDR